MQYRIDLYSMSMNFGYPLLIFSAIAINGAFPILFSIVLPVVDLTLINLTTSMNKVDIVTKVQDVLGGTKADADRAVETMISCIVDGLKSGDEVSIAGLGIFSAKARPARTGRNPRTGETIKIAATRTPKFRAAKALKDAVK
jgi:DNA-binding protein HU-beta